MPTEDETGAHAGTNQEDRPEEAIRRRAYEISQSDAAGSPTENWERAERELKSGN